MKKKEEDTFIEKQTSLDISLTLIDIIKSHKLFVKNPQKGKGEVFEDFLQKVLKILYRVDVDIQRPFYI